MKKKLICALLAIVMIVGSVSVLASCGGSDVCEEHVDKDKDYKCDVCNESLVKKHTKHTDKNKDGVCDFEGCGVAVTDSGNEEEAPDYYWDSTNLIYRMTNCDGGDLTSTCARYLAGEWTGTVDTIDTAVTNRNEAAVEHANIGEITYLYYPNTATLPQPKFAVLG